MIRYYMHGFSAYAASMFFEILGRCYGDSGHACIVLNRAESSSEPFIYPGWEYDFIDASGWVVPDNGRHVLGVNKPESKKAVAAAFASEFGIRKEQYRTEVDPSAVVARTAGLGCGIWINPGVVVASYATIGSFVTINRAATVGHHTRIDDFTTIHPGVNIAGNCTIEEGVTIGMGANIIDGITVGKNATIGAGAVVTKDIPAGAFARGSPARFAKGASDTV